MCAGQLPWFNVAENLWLACPGLICYQILAIINKHGQVRDEDLLNKRQPTTDISSDDSKECSVLWHVLFSLQFFPKPCRGVFDSQNNLKVH